jgi:hypothetical protein
MYYKLSTDLTPDAMNVYVRPVNNEDAPLDDGEVIDVAEEEIVLPFEYTMSVEQDENGTPQELRMAIYYPGIELMRQDLLEVLHGAGVDNLQTFPAVIREEGNDRVIESYQVVNVVGLVACADGEASESMPFANGEYFTKLVIDPTRTGGLPMFRLAESQMDVIVHQHVADAIAEKQFPGLQLVPVE